MSERFTHVRVLVWAALLETVRRKDVYVVWLLALFGIAAGSTLARLGVRGIETFLRDVTLSVVNFLSTILCIWLAARQIPEEIARRTLFPLLARPVRRVDVLIARLLAVWLLSTGALLVLGGVAWGCLAQFRAGVGPILWQCLLLRSLSFGPVAALSMALSLALTPPAAVTLAALLTTCGTLFGRSLEGWVHDGPAALHLPLKLLYFLLPHLDLFDLSQRAAYNYPPVPLWVLGVMTLYALAYAAAFLALGQLRFRRMIL